MMKKDNSTQKSFDTYSEISTDNKACLAAQHLQTRKRVLRLGDITINIESIFTGKVTLDKALWNIVAQKIK